MARSCRERSFSKNDSVDAELLIEASDTMTALPDDATTEGSPAAAAAENSSDTVLVLRAGDAIPEVSVIHGEFARWIERSVGEVWTGRWHEHDVRVDGSIPSPDDYAAIIITGSIASVTERAPWM